VEAPRQTADWRALLRQLGPLNRVHNGPEFSEAVRLIERYIEASDFDGECRIVRFPAGAEINTWLVPPRWTVDRFSVIGPDGTEYAGAHPLALTPFSSSFQGTLGLDELRSHIHSRADLPNEVPFVFRRMYRHWDKGWGIAIPQAVADRLPAGDYTVDIQTRFTDEPLEMIEYRSKGRSRRLIQAVAHLDHPGQFNDSLSGVVGVLEAVRRAEKLTPDREVGFSVLACPEIVGSSVYLATDPVAGEIDYCLSVNMLGHDAPLALCLTKNEGTQVDLALHLALLEAGVSHVVGEWHRYPDCGDEISYDTPGIAIPAATLSRIGEMFPYYHSSADTEDKVDPARFEEAVGILASAMSHLAQNAVPEATFKGLPSLANPRLDLYLEPQNLNNMANPNAEFGLKNLRTGAPLELRLFQEFFVSNLTGKASLLDMAYVFGAPFELVRGYAQAFRAKGLVEFRAGPVSESNHRREVVFTAQQRHQPSADGRPVSTRTGARI
jgi:aminopeptidase-like protein